MLAYLRNFRFETDPGKQGRHLCAEAAGPPVRLICRAMQDIAHHQLSHDCDDITITGLVRTRVATQGIIGNPPDSDVHWGI